MLVDRLSVVSLVLGLGPNIYNAFVLQLTNCVGPGIHSLLLITLARAELVRLHQNLPAVLESQISVTSFWL